MIGGGQPFLPEILDQTDRDLFARSNSAVTPSEKSSINANKKFTTHFPMSPRLTSYVVPKPPPSPKEWLKTQSVQNLNNKLQ